MKDKVKEILLGGLSKFNDDDLIIIKREIQKILKARNANQQITTKERKRDVFISVLNGITYSELSKKYKVSNSVIRNDFRFSLARTLSYNNLQEKVLGDKSAWSNLSEIKNKLDSNKDLLIKTFRITY